MTGVGTLERIAPDEASRTMSTTSSYHVPWPLWPLAALWRLLTFIVCAVGRILCALLGLGLMAGGVALTLSIVGAVAGVPLAVLGFLLLVRALF